LRTRPNGVLSIYSAGAGQKALDTLGDGDPNSVFTRVFVKELKKPGVGLREIAFRTQGEVAKLASANGYNQVPGVYSQIIGDDFYLTRPSAPMLAAPPLTNTEQTDLAAALQSGSIAQLDLFLSRYPKSPLVDIVRRERERLTKASDQLGQLPDSPHLPPASIATVSAADPSPVAASSETPIILPAQTVEPPSSPSFPKPNPVKTVSVRPDGSLVFMDEVAWQKAKSTRTRDAVKKFLREFPDSKRRNDAEVLLANLTPATPIEQSTAPETPLEYSVVFDGACNFKFLNRDSFFQCDRKVSFVNFKNHTSEFTFRKDDTVFVFFGRKDRQPNLENYFLSIDTAKFGSSEKGVQGKVEGECHLRQNADATRFYEIKCDVFDRKSGMMFNFYLTDITDFKKGT
jgi:hypothetical protein